MISITLILVIVVCLLGFLLVLQANDARDLRKRIEKLEGLMVFYHGTIDESVKDADNSIEADRIEFANYMKSVTEELNEEEIIELTDLIKEEPQIIELRAEDEVVEEPLRLEDLLEGLVTFTDGFGKTQSRSYKITPLRRRWGVERKPEPGPKKPKELEPKKLEGVRNLSVDGPKVRTWGRVTSQMS